MGCTLPPRTLGCEVAAAGRKAGGGGDGAPSMPMPSLEAGGKQAAPVCGEFLGRG